MALQHRIQFLPGEAKTINPHLAAARYEGRITFFNASGPIFTCTEDDQISIRYAVAILTDPEIGLATPGQLAPVLNRHRSRVYEYRDRYIKGGAGALEVKRRGPRGPNKFKGILIARAQKYLDEGKSNRMAGEAVGVDEKTIRKAIKEGRLVRPESASRVSKALPDASSSTPRERSDEDASCAGGIATKREEDRALAPAGLLPEAKPRFEAAGSVAKAGVLVALPALLGQGLLEVGQRVYGSLKNGYYGLNAILLTLGMMALLRIKSTEGLSGHSPGEFGIVLGLDRAPEMKTARRKLAELSDRGCALEFSRAFTERWAKEDPGALAYLYIDGHVRPYHGDKYRLPKTHVQRRRLCMPATTDYWVNDADAEPLLFVTAPANEGLLAMMDKELLPEIRKMAGEGRRVTLIFDREGWSPKLFSKWEKAGFDVISYRKGKYADWPRSCFKDVEAEVCGRQAKYFLAEQVVQAGRGFRMREVRRLCDDGHQTSVMTTRGDIPIEEVAVRMFSRWQQENFFRYMRHEFALDHLPTTAAEKADPERSVPNPALKEKKKELELGKAMLAKAEQAYGQRLHDNRERQRRTVRGFKISNAELGRKIRSLRLLCERLESEARALPKRVPVREVMDGEPVVQLERERKTITDTIKMVGYRAETRLADLVRPLLSYRDDEARKFLRQVFNLPADVIPDHEKNKLAVHLHSLAKPRDNGVLASLCQVLNDMEILYPGTELQLVFEATHVASESR